MNLLQRISLALVAVSFAGVPVEVVNAFEYLQGARLTLIASDPGVTATLCILSVTRVILIILNLQFCYFSDITDFVPYIGSRAVLQ